MINITTATLLDIDSVSSLIKEFLSEIEPNYRQQIQATDYATIAGQLLSDNAIHILLALANSTPVGIITLNQCAALYAEGYFGEISELYVQPEFRNQKIGIQLINSARQHAMLRNWKSLEVGTPPRSNNSRAEKFYRANGFSDMGRRMGCYL